MVWELFLKAHKFHIETFDSTLNANLKTKLKQKQNSAYVNVVGHKTK